MFLKASMVLNTTLTRSLQLFFSALLNTFDNYFRVPCRIRLDKKYPIGSEIGQGMCNLTVQLLCSQGLSPLSTSTHLSRHNDRGQRHEVYHFIFKGEISTRFSRPRVIYVKSEYYLKHSVNPHRKR